MNCSYFERLPYGSYHLKEQNDDMLHRTQTFHRIQISATSFAFIKKKKMFHKTQCNECLLLHGVFGCSECSILHVMKFVNSIEHVA